MFEIRLTSVPILLPPPRWDFTTPSTPSRLSPRPWRSGRLLAAYRMDPFQKTVITRPRNRSF
jgi:hypothetical protein